MKAFVLKELNKYPELESVQFPTLSHDHEVYLKINASALNHRDLWIVNGLYPNIKLNSVLGSDACGTSCDSRFLINPVWIGEIIKIISQMSFMF
jgi:zinc-binding alcohol dehydrogenase/oxidoreductase